MSRRQMVLSAGLIASTVLWAGCQSRTTPVPTPGGAAVATGAGDRPATAPGVVPSSKGREDTPAPAGGGSLRISPAEFTITADDPGLQLLVARNEDPSGRDLTSQVQWTVEPPGVAEIEPGGYLRPIGDGTVTVKAALESQSAVATFLLQPRSPRSWDFGRTSSRSSAGSGATRARATARQPVRTAFISRSSATTMPAISSPWLGMPASGGSRSWFRKTACFSPRPRDASPTRAARGSRSALQNTRRSLPGSATERRRLAAKRTA